MISKIARGLLTILIVFLIGIGVGMANPTTGGTSRSPVLNSVSRCDFVDWTEKRDDGRPFIPQDLNRDGFIDCDSDSELGAWY